MSMKSATKKGKRGRPKKVTIQITKSTIEEPIIGEENIEIVVPEIKRKRGRPAKVAKGEEVVKSKELMAAVEEDYVQPTIMRKKRVFRFDKKVFHQFAKKYNGDIVIMSYVFDRLMRLYNEKKLDIPAINNKYYTEWFQGNPLLEPIEEKELASTNAMLRGIPVQYKYSLLVDKEMYDKFERDSKVYSQYVSNELVKMLLDNKVTIDTAKYKEWCIL